MAKPSFWSRFEKKITLTGITCPACSEDKALHNTSRNRACTAQLQQPTRNEIGRLQRQKQAVPSELYNKLETIKNFS